MAKKKADQEKLRLWQERLKTNQSAYQARLDEMDAREALYLGARAVKPLAQGDRKRKTPHVRNLCAEIIESQVDSTIPQPKVTARRKQDEGKAKLIEDMLRNELDRMPFEMLNDMMERTVPIQGGAAFLVEWDNTERTHATVGELSVTAMHPKQIIPQDGVYTGIEDMDYIILKLPQTKEYIKRRYHLDVADEGEQEPEVKGSGEESVSEDMVTQYAAYYRNDKGGIGLYSWVGDVELEDLEDYQARRLRRCAKCGAVEPLETQSAGEDGGWPDPITGILAGAEPTGGFGGMEGLERAQAQFETQSAPRARRGGRKTCPYCGGSAWEESMEDFEELYTPVLRSDGSAVGGMVQRLEDTGETDETGRPILTAVFEPERVPFYKPDIYPILLQKNVSVYGQFLGDSDLDKIADQQNTTNRIESKIIDKLCRSGSYITLPPRASIEVSGEDMKVIRLDSPADAQLIGVYTLQGDVEKDLTYLAQVYEEARQIIGITDSYQGRKDSTASSGKAKEFSAAQAAGRLESKRVMKQAAYAGLFEAMFKFKLAYADEPRPVVSHDNHGNSQYSSFNRYDFLEKDEAGEWYWNDQFLFSCDTSNTLANNREAMWQETRQNLQTGAFGDPASLQTLVLFWTKMELLHYPGAADTRSYLEEELQRQQQQQAMMTQLQQLAQQQRAAQQTAAQAGANPAAQDAALG